ncbi:MAG: kelch repeat-containing protein [Bacteroidota bacterium]
MNNFYKYESSTDQWSEIAVFPGNARSGATGFSVGGFGYVGLGKSSSFHNDFWKYDPATDSWTQITSFPGEPRYGVVSFVIGGYAYVGTGTAGETGMPSEKMFNDFWRYDPSTDSWTQIASLETPGRAFAFSFASSTKGYVGTGFPGLQSGRDLYDDFWEYDPNTDEWSERKKLISSGEGGIAFYVHGRGYTNIDVSFGGFYYYDADTDEWINSRYFVNIDNSALGLSTSKHGYMLAIESIWSTEQNKSVYQLQLYEFSPLPE